MPGPDDVHRAPPRQPRHRLAGDAEDRGGLARVDQSFVAKLPPPRSHRLLGRAPHVVVHGVGDDGPHSRREGAPRPQQPERADLLVHAEARATLVGGGAHQVGDGRETCLPLHQQPADPRDDRRRERRRLLAPDRAHGVHVRVGRRPDHQRDGDPELEQVRRLLVPQRRVHPAHRLGAHVRPRVDKGRQLPRTLRVIELDEGLGVVPEVDRGIAVLVHARMTERDPAGDGPAQAASRSSRWRRCRCPGAGPSRASASR